MAARARRILFLVIGSALSAFPQTPLSEPVVLPSAETAADITLPLPSPLSKNSVVRPGPLVDLRGKTISPLPVISDVQLNGDNLQLHLAELYFWGAAKLPIEILPGTTFTWTIQRGPGLSSRDIRVERGAPAEVWLYNFEKSPVRLKWRISSGTDTICGPDANGNPRLSCAGNWSDAVLGPARSDRLAFEAPDAWFDPWKAFGSDVRQALLELHFGDADTGPEFRVPVELHLHCPLWNIFIVYVPAWLRHVIWVTFWVTLGAVLLMLAQIMIPNFRQCLRMESQIEDLHERLRAITSGVGNRLYTRCHQELESVRAGLAMHPGRNGLASWDRLALSGNTAEVNRLSGVLPKIESRIRLTQQLDEIQSAAVDGDSLIAAPSLTWDRKKQLLRVQSILARQFVTEADEKNASAILDDLADIASMAKDFATDVEKRVAGLRRQFGAEPFKTQSASLIAGLSGCAELLQNAGESVPTGGWSVGELIFRDLAAVRLSTIAQMIEIAPLLNARPDIQKGILEKLQSNDCDKLNDAHLDLLKLSQGYWEADVKKALEEKMWDTYLEPVTVTDQDVIRASFIFRNQELNRCAAKNTFQCYWHIEAKNSYGSEEEFYEPGWEVQYIPVRGTNNITAEVYDATGKELAIRPSGDSDKDPDKDKGIWSIPVSAPASTTLHRRLLRGLIDAAITALVPVITVAVTQAQNGGDLAMDKLVLLGFTSQAIRAAVVPESIKSASEAPNSAPAAHSGD